MAKENLFFFAFPSAAYLIKNFCKRVQSKFTFRLPSAAKIYSKIVQTRCRHIHRLLFYALQGHQRIAQGNALGINVKAIYAQQGQKRHSICQMNQKKEKKLLYKTILLLVRDASKNTIS